MYIIIKYNYWNHNSAACSLAGLGVTSWVLPRGLRGHNIFTNNMYWTKLGRVFWIWLVVILSIFRCFKCSASDFRTASSVSTTNGITTAGLCHSLWISILRSWYFFLFFLFINSAMTAMLYQWWSLLFFCYYCDVCYVVHQNFHQFVKKTPLGWISKGAIEDAFHFHTLQSLLSCRVHYRQIFPN